MSTRGIFIVALIALIFAGVLAHHAQGDETADVRAAVQRSLPYLEKGGTAWMQVQKCNSCHTVPFMIWSHNEAAARGLDVDRKKLDQWTRWSLADALGDHYWFKLRPRSIQALSAAKLPGDLLDKVKPLAGKIYLTQKQYVDALEKAIGSPALTQYRDLLIAQATLPNDGGGPDTLAQLLLGRSTAPQDKATSDSYQAVRSLLRQWQDLDGSWQAAGQLPSVKWKDSHEMNQATTMWSLLAMGEPQSRPGAMRLINSASPGITLQPLALRMMLAEQAGDHARAQTLRTELLARQNPDGGWSWLQDNKTSDAFASGQALYGLGRIGRDGTNPEVRKAWNFLLRTQGTDGSWDVPQEAINTRKRKLNVFSYWGTGWSAIGLLQTLPPATAAAR